MPDMFATPGSTWPAIERRGHRPSDLPSALTCAFDHAVQRAGLDLVLVADEYGTLVARSSTALDLGELAAVTPIVGRGRARALVRRGGKPREFSVRRLHVLGETLYVGALGGATSGREREVLVSAAATRRILTT